MDSPIWVVVASLLGGLAGALAVAVVVMRRERTGGALRGAQPAGGGTAEADRAVLVDAAIEVRDLVTSDALGDKLGAALARAGVSEVVVDGQRFDPQSHVAVDRATTDDPSQQNLIAATERVGYDDRGRSIRLPEVVVYRLDPDEPNP